MSKNKRQDNSIKVQQRDKVNDTFEITPFKWTEKQQILINTVLDKKTQIIFIKAPAGTGKAQPLDAKIITPVGIKEMKDIVVGDSVSTPDGNSANVIGVFPQGEKDIYKVTFSDGTYTECCGEHLWSTQSNKELGYRIEKNGKRFNKPKDFSVKDTLSIKNTLFENIKYPRLNHRIPLTKPVNFIVNEVLPIHPYLLGVLIGDGCIRYGIQITSADTEIIEKIKTIIPSHLQVNKKKHSDIEYSIIDNTCSWAKKNTIKKSLIDLGLMGKYSYEKSIPDIYKFSSIEDRIELLRGLMDTDGTTDGYNSSFCTTSTQLSLDFRWLVESLGGFCTLNIKKSFYTYKGIRKQGKDAYILTVKLSGINPFSLKRKASKYIEKTKYKPIRLISNIEYIGKKYCQCILIDNNEHLYLTNNFIVTHNTLLSVFCSLVLLKNKSIGEVIFLRCPLESTKSIGFLPAEKEAKLDVYATPLYDHLKELINKPTQDKLIKDERIRVESVGFIKGCTFNATAVICDEAEDLDLKELRLVMGRQGKFSKLFIIGDEKQSNIRNNGFTKVFNAFNNPKSLDQGISAFEFTVDDIMRNGLLKFVLGELDKLS